MGKISLLTVVGDDVDVKKIEKQDQLLAILNTPPPPEWIKEHPLAKGVKYLPIDKVEILLTRIYQNWSVEVLDAKQMLNAISVTVRLKYKNPVTQEWESQDGVGAAPIQTDKGKSASELIHVKSDAIPKGLPAAKSFAIKDAADHLGKLFGRDLNRRDTVSFTSAYSEENLAKKKEDAVKKLDESN